VVNWIIASVLLSPPSRATVSYTFFVSQVQAKNVETITSTGEMIQGTFTKSVSYTPQGGSAEQVTPVHDAAAQLRELQSLPAVAEHGRAGQRQPTRRRPTVLAATAPRLRADGVAGLVADLVHSVGGGAGGVLGSFGRSRATLYRPESGCRSTRQGRR
jgi:cell division protease FtsH